LPLLILFCGMIACIFPVASITPTDTPVPSATPTFIPTRGMETPQSILDLSTVAITNEDIKFVLGDTLSAFYYSPTDEKDQNELPCEGAEEEFSRTFKSMLVDTENQQRGTIMVILCRFSSIIESSVFVDMCLGIEGIEEVGLSEGLFSGRALMGTTSGGGALCFNQGQVLAMLLMVSIPDVDDQAFIAYLTALGLLQQSHLQDAGYK